jgi:hypothetical protein
MGGPNKLRSYIRILTNIGERNPEKIAKAALTERSTARIATPRI